MARAEVVLLDLSRVHANASIAVTYAIESLKAKLAAKRFAARSNERIYREMRRDLPYIIHETSIENVRVLVNREYKPLGSNLRTGSDQVKYEDYPHLHVRLTPEQIASVVNPPHEFGLFGDGSAPWLGRKEANAYLVRLQRLGKILEM